MLLNSSKERLCKPCLGLLDPRSAVIGCPNCLKPLKELGDENPHEGCSCKEQALFYGVLYLEPMNGVLSSLIKSKALVEESGIAKALSAYLLQVALESGKPLPEAILALSPSNKEERLIKRELEKMLGLKNCLWDAYVKSWNPLIRMLSYLKLKAYCRDKTVWMIGIKKHMSQVEFWRESIKDLKLKEASLIVISCD